MTESQLHEPECELPFPARLGETLGKYRLDRIVAAGGMGLVVAATHLQLDQPVAIKFMSPLLADDGANVRRFLQEARAAAKLRSEHVVRVHDVDTLPTGTPYIVMELLEGEDMKATLERRGRLPPSEVVDCVLQACEAVAEAHLLGIVHRDLKPGNLFYCTRPDGLRFVKVLDFGVSKLLSGAQDDPADQALTGPHVIMGTPRYSSPEQLRCSSEVDVRTDIWALGVILYELIAGEPPFVANSFFEICAKVALAPCPPLQELWPEVPPGLGAVVAKCLAKDPAERHQTVADLAEALAPYASRGSLLSVQRVENIRRAQRALDATLPSPTTDATLPSAKTDATLPSATTPRPATVPPAVVSGPREVHPLRVTLASLAGGVIGGALIAAWVLVATANPQQVRRALAPDGAPAARSTHVVAAPSTAVFSAAVRPERVEAPAASIPPRGRAIPSQPPPGTAGFGGLL
jgi:serine/threonine-protein kinase